MHWEVVEGDVGSGRLCEREIDILVGCRAMLRKLVVNASGLDP
jgi:hypothetical protein